jgi:hypothetical protein
MSGKNCLKHKDQPSVTMCHQCHHPLCKSCVMVTPAGTFCSSECSIIFKEMKAKLGDKKKKGSSAGLVFVFIVLLAVASLFVIHFAARDKEHDHFLRKIDVIGRFLDKPIQ